MTQGGPGGRVWKIRRTMYAIEIGKYVPSTLPALKTAPVFSRGVKDSLTLDDEGLEVK